ncbi:signal recognition particle 14 kDa protein isoform X1 [Halichoerus grypus]|uniref:signal recognition particle 14 kDa protein isoform X1 n=1 Tax=Halichoerus grypus TaxID=9711 RepID=UPI00165942D8|nr:signal recognition particle 14 kDa protein isoform X1 [Halichoerus grypus]
MVLLESEQFLTELTRLFQKCRLSGSVFITLKKYDGRTKPIPRKGSIEGFEPSDNKCLLRATDGKKKISTVVSSKEVNKFQMEATENEHGPDHEVICYWPLESPASSLQLSDSTNGQLI